MQQTDPNILSLPKTVAGQRYRESRQRASSCSGKLISSTDKGIWLETEDGSVVSFTFPGGMAGRIGQRVSVIHAHGRAIALRNHAVSRTMAFVTRPAPSTFIKLASLATLAALVAVTGFNETNIMPIAATGMLFLMCEMETGLYWSDPASAFIADAEADFPQLSELDERWQPSSQRGVDDAGRIRRVRALMEEDGTISRRNAIIQVAGEDNLRRIEMKMSRESTLPPVEVMIPDSGRVLRPHRYSGQAATMIRGQVTSLHQHGLWLTTPTGQELPFSFWGQNKGVRIGDTVEIVHKDGNAIAIENTRSGLVVANEGLINTTPLLAATYGLATLFLALSMTSVHPIAEGVSPGTLWSQVFSFSMLTLCVGSLILVVGTLQRRDLRFRLSPTKPFRTMFSS